MVLPFRRIKKTNLQSLHWSFGFIEISSFTPSTRSKIQKKNFFGFTHASFKHNFHSTGDHTLYWSIMTADDIIKYVGGRTQTWQAKWAVFKILGFEVTCFLTEQKRVYLISSEYVTSWSYCSRGKWPIDYQNDQSSLFRGSYKHISKIFHLEYTRYVRVLGIGRHIGSALRNVSTFCGSFLSLLSKRFHAVQEQRTRNES